MLEAHLTRKLKELLLSASMAAWANYVRYKHAISSKVLHLQEVHVTATLQKCVLAWSGVHMQEQRFRRIVADKRQVRTPPPPTAAPTHTLTHIP